MKTWISDHPRDKTAVGIESVVEWIEARGRAFTTREAFHGAQLNPDERWEYPDPSHSTVYRTIRELERHGLVMRVTGRNAKPAGSRSTTRRNCDRHHRPDRRRDSVGVRLVLNEESWNRDRAGLTATAPRVASVVRHSPAGDEVVLEIVVDMSHFESRLRMARESLVRFHRAVEIAGRRMGRAAGIPDGFLAGDWTDIGFTTGGVLEAQQAAEPSSEPTRADRMQAALDARRNRNTGPTHRPRAPKYLGGRTPR